MCGVRHSIAQAACDVSADLILCMEASAAGSRALHPIDQMLLLVSGSR